MSIETLPLRPEHVAAARALQQNTPMSTALALTSERRGDAPYSHFPGRSIEKVALHQGRVVGYLHGDVHPARLVVDGMPCTAPALYLGDLRVSHEARRLGVASRLLDAIADEANALGVRHGYSLVNHGNSAIMRFLASDKCRFNGGPVRRFVTATALGLLPPRLPRQSVYVRVDVERVQLGRLLERRASLVFSPVETAEALQALLRESAADMHCFAHRDSPHELAFIVWNQSARRRFCVLQSSLTDRLLTRAWQGLTQLTGGPVPPGTGGYWHPAELGWLARPVDKDMIHVARHSAWQLGAHFVNVPAFPGATRGLSWRTLDTDLVAFGVDGHTPPELPAHLNAELELTRT